MDSDTTPRRADQLRPNGTRLSTGKRRAWAFLAIALGPAMAVALASMGLNAYVDPLWALPKFGERPFHYCVKDDRQNKINRLLHGHVSERSVLLGSSRSALVDPADFTSSRVFNSSVDAMMPVEYAEFARLFRENVADPRTVYAAFDFSRYASTPQANELFIKQLREREALSLRPLYPLDQILDPQVLAYSIDTLLKCNSRDNNGTVFYSYNGFRYAKRVSDEVRRKTIQSQIARLNYTDGNFLIDSAFRSHLDELKRAAPNSAFVVYVTPVSIDLLMAQVMSGRLLNYFEWIEHLLDAFGAVYHFNGVNQFTRREQNFFDSNHIYGDASARLVAILEQRESATADGFGERITKETFPRFKEVFRAAVCKELSIRMPRPPAPIVGCPEIVPAAPTLVAQDSPPATAPMPETDPFVPFSLQMDATDANWIAGMQGSAIQIKDRQMLIRGGKSKWGYQLQSSPIATATGRSYVLHLDMDVFSGAVGVGILDDVAHTFGMTQRIQRGPQRIAFKAPSNRIKVILFNNNDSEQTTLAVVRALTVTEAAKGGDIQ